MMISKAEINSNKNDVIRVVLDEPRLYIEESLGLAMVRGEVIVNFAKDTHIQGPIELLFEGIQRFEPWRGIESNLPIETKLQVIELSLLPPNSKGIMPSGIQRFPFEFPIPSTLPTTVHIPNRIEIFYQLTTTIRGSLALDQQETTKNNLNWIDWIRHNSSKKDYIACSPIRIVRSLESIVSGGLPTENTNQTSISIFPVVPISTSTSSVLITEELAHLPWNRRGLNQYQATIDELHDQLAYSLSGRTSSNLNRLINTLDKVQGIRYNIGIDRTAIAIGTSVGIEVMIEPTFANATIKSIVLKISEERKYVVKIPLGRNKSNLSYETKRQRESVAMLLKWAYGYQGENEEDEVLIEKKNMANHSNKPVDKYIRQRSSSSRFLSHFDPPSPGSSSNKNFLGSVKKPNIFLDSEEKNHGFFSSGNAIQADKTCELINLKELNQEVNIGEYFGGRFVMPVPDCSNILQPSMEYESITINHWLQLVVTIECNGKTFEIMLESPARVLDCRVVSVDDECQTILPPPPSYKSVYDHSNKENVKYTGTFWEQREAITNVSWWGSCMPCPCQYKQMKSMKNPNNNINASDNNNNKGKNTSTINTTETCPPNLLPEWGPPPCYSEI